MDPSEATRPPEGELDGDDDRVRAFVRDSLRLDEGGRQFAAGGLAAGRHFIDVVVPSGLAAKLVFRGWGARCGAFFVLETPWPDQVERTHADDLRRIREAVAAIEVPRRDGRPICRIDVTCEAWLRPQLDPRDVAWGLRVISSVVRVAESWGADEWRSYGVSPEDVRSANGLGADAAGGGR